MTTIRVPRPEDPELQQLWDEAREAVEARRYSDSREAIRERLFPCICGKHNVCCCRMRLPVVDEQVPDDGDAQ